MNKIKLNSMYGHFDTDLAINEHKEMTKKLEKTIDKLYLLTLSSNDFELQREIYKIYKELKEIWIVMVFNDGKEKVNNTPLARWE